MLTRQLITEFIISRFGRSIQETPAVKEIHAYALTRTRTHTGAHAHAHPYTCTHAHARTHTREYTDASTRTRVHAHTQSLPFSHTHIYIYIYSTGVLYTIPMLYIVRDISFEIICLKTIKKIWHFLTSLKSTFFTFSSYN